MCAALLLADEPGDAQVKEGGLCKKATHSKLQELKEFVRLKFNLRHL